MAELIPLHYRLRVATRDRLHRWAFFTIITSAVCAAAVLSAYAWNLGSAGRLARLRGEHQAGSSLIVRSQELRSKRMDLANRMEKIQQIMDDRVLLTLLRNISDGFSENDAVEFIHIDAKNVTKTDAANGAAAPATPNANTDNRPEGQRFLVHITGITHNSTTLAQLMSRLSKSSDIRLNVILESSHRENYLDGQVMRFQITCERALPNG